VSSLTVVLLLVVLAAAVAVAAAIRSTWSPCGQSMLSTITPLGEQGRGNRFGVTATWFVLGATLGGLTLGLGAALLAAIAGVFGVSAATALAVGGVLAAVAAAADARLFGLVVPYHRRQVNEYWLDDYRPWVYGGGFGWQIGVGFATYIMTSAIVLLVALAALTGEPLVALGLGGLFGFGRGLGVLPGARLTTPEKLATFHTKFDARAELSRKVVIAVQLVVAVIAIGAVAGVVVAAASAAVIAVLFALGRRRTAHRRELASS
jgi:MFS family permease